MKMYSKGFYGVVHVNKDVFNKIDKKYLISGCTDSLKYLCANPSETKHLIDLGVDTNDVVCDWYKVILEN